MVGRTPEKLRIVAQRQECRGRHVEHQPVVSEKEEGQAIETVEGDAERRPRDAHAFQGDGPGNLQASGDAFYTRAFRNSVNDEATSAMLSHVGSSMLSFS